MSVLPILTYGAEVLRKPAQTVSQIDDEIQKLIDDMAETMFAAPGVGLAAPQIGVSKRIIVFSSLDDLAGKDFFVLINPEIVSAQGEMLTDEGCLSVPGFQTEVPRAERVVVRGLDREGKPIEMEAVGLMARVLQHEIDHLNGILHLDRLSSAKRDIINRKLKKDRA